MYKYLLIDDEDISGFAETLSETADILAIRIHIEYFNPTTIRNSWDAVVEKLMSKEYSGIITDQRLDGASTPNGIKYRGTSLSQNIRTLANENQINSFPIVLYYAPTFENASHSLFKDTRGTDLFDLKYNKDDVVSYYYPQLVRELFALSDAYEKIENIESIQELLQMQNIDARIVKMLGSKKESTHEFALFFESEILFTSGILINEDILAARLGVDKNCPDWSILKEKLKEENFKEGETLHKLAYKGIFSFAWERWWNENILQWWKLITNSKKALSTYSATERITILNKYFSLSLEPAEMCKGSSSNYFWTVCAESQKPIDTIDGILTNKPKTYFWQDTEYVCKEFVNQNRDWDKYNPIEESVVNQVHSTNYN